MIEDSKLPTKEKIVAIQQSNYIPWKGYFDVINSVDEFYFCDFFQYTKGDWRNRNKIKTGYGARWLSVPVLAKNHYTIRIDQAVTDGVRWRKDHWRRIVRSYSQAPFFSSYSEQFKKHIVRSDEQMLHRINQMLIREICTILGIETRLLNCPEIKKDKKRTKTQGLIAMMKAVEARHCLLGPNVRNYLDVTEFRQAGLIDLWMDYSDYPEYSQLFPPFVHEVSVLDLIFTEGPRAHEFLKSFQPGWRDQLLLQPHSTR